MSIKARLRESPLQTNNNVGRWLAPPAFYFNIPQNKKRTINDRPYRTTLNFVGVDALGDPFYRTAPPLSS